MNPALHQWFTPPWVCEAIVERHFARLDMGDLVLEPSCGDGRFLQAIPEHVGAIGVEIDPKLADLARRATGRPVITGDFLEVDLPKPTHIVGNPPFESALIHRFLRRSHDLLDPGGACVLLLPAYVLQTSSKVMQMNRDWSISCELMPRNVFPRLRLPLVLARFQKDSKQTLFGFFLYPETNAIGKLPKDVRAQLETPGRSVWRRAVRVAFERVGQPRAHLDDLYAAVERPSENRHWREKVRQTLQVYPEFKRAGPGAWAIAEAA